MREILFRGKTLNNEWVQGTYYRQTEFYGDDFERHYIITTTDELEDNMMNVCLVIPETVGQYTGLTDKKGKKIFEGDIVDVAYDVNYVGVSAERIGLFEVVFEKGCFMKKAINDPQISMFEKTKKYGLYHFIASDVCQIVGNIYDNPELVGGK